MTQKVLALLTFFSFLLLPQLALSAGESHGAIKSIGGKDLNLSSYKGKVVLITNIATKCGYTPQLKGLEALHQKYNKKGLVILGIPSNDFGGQTPETNKGVKKFCKLNYGVSFQLTEKAIVKGEKKHPFIKKLLSESKNKNEIGWNFEKFLINKKGKVVSRFESSVKPQDKTLVDAVIAEL